MNNLDSFSDEQVQQWALRQLTDYDSHHPGTLFAESVVFDVEQGYKIQSAVSQLRVERGEQIIGYKVGCTSPVIRSQLGINHCVMGRLYDSELRFSGAELSRKDFDNLAIEGELAVELSREPVDSDFLTTDIPACVERVFPVIELHNLVMRGEQPSAGELIANNAIHAGFVAGTGLSRSQLVEKSLEDSLKLSLFADNHLIEQCSGPSLIQTISSSLKWLTSAIREIGSRLTAGHIVLTGSIPSLIPIQANTKICVEALPFGEVQTTISE